MADVLHQLWLHVFLQKSFTDEAPGLLTGLLVFVLGGMQNCMHGAFCKDSNSVSLVSLG